MQVIRHDLHGKNFAVEFGEGISDNLLQAFFECSDQDFSPAFGTPDQVIVAEKDAGFFVLIGLWHTNNITQSVLKSKSKQHAWEESFYSLEGAWVLHPRAKAPGLSTPAPHFCKSGKEVRKASGIPPVLHVWPVFLPWFA